MSRELYQRIYEKESWYGDADIDRCPGFRLMPMYLGFLEGRIVELGCGRGSVVTTLLSKGYDIIGYDQVSINPDMHVGDVTDENLAISGDTVLCIDVIEHIDDKRLQGLYYNFKKFKKQVFSIHNGPSMYKGEDLHVNKKPFDEWESIINKEGFCIKRKKKLGNKQCLFFTEYTPKF